MTLQVIGPHCDCFTCIRVPVLAYGSESPIGMLDHHPEGKDRVVDVGIWFNMTITKHKS